MVGLAANADNRRADNQVAGSALGVEAAGNTEAQQGARAFSDQTTRTRLGARRITAGTDNRHCAGATETVCLGRQSGDDAETIHIP